MERKGKGRRGKEKMDEREVGEKRGGRNCKLEREAEREREREREG